MTLLLIIACMDSSLHRITEYPTEEEAFDTGESPPEEGTAPCAVATFTWRAPLAGWLHVEGEIQSADGEVLVPWSSWSDPLYDSTVEAEFEVCEGAAFRGTGIADLEGDGVDDAWTCTLQATGDFAMTGEVEFRVDGRAADLALVPDPTSDGCGVLATFPQTELE